ncbi:MAG: hypothetical protein ABFD03_05750 [Clostridiaceae bacterium]
MKQEFFKRAFALFAAVVLIFVFGCSKSPEATETTDPAGETQASSDSGSTTIDHSGIYNVDGTEDTSESGTYASSAEDENVVLVQNAGTLTMTSADINKLGDASGDFSAGQSAAVAVIGGTLTLEKSNITTNALGAYGLYAGGADTVVSASDTYLSTSGASSAGLVSMDGGTLSFTRGTVATEGEDSPCVLLGGSSSLTLDGVTLSAASGELVRVLTGDNNLSINAMALSSPPVIAEDASLMLTLTNGASLSGSLGDALPPRAGISLDATSTWTLTADAYVSVFLNADATHQNIVSNGFSIYYDSNAPENEVLGGQSFSLPGGGYLVPLI